MYRMTLIVLSILAIMAVTVHAVTIEEYAMISESAQTMQNTINIMNEFRSGVSTIKKIRNRIRAHRGLIQADKASQECLSEIDMMCIEVDAFLEKFEASHRVFLTGHDGSMEAGGK